MSTKLVEFRDGITPLNEENLNPIARLAERAEELGITANTDISRLTAKNNVMQMMMAEMIATFGSPITVGQVAQLSDTYGLRVGHTEKLRPTSSEESMPTVARIAIVGRTILTGLARSL